MTSVWLLGKANHTCQICRSWLSKWVYASSKCYKPPIFPHFSLYFPFYFLYSCSFLYTASLPHALHLSPIYYASYTALCWVTPFISTHCDLLARLTRDSDATHLDSLYAPFPLTHSVFFMYINPVNYLWAPQLNLLYSWCNTELFTWAFGTEPGPELDLLFRSVLDLLDSELTYTRLNSSKYAQVNSSVPHQEYCLQQVA